MQKDKRLWWIGVIYVTKPDGRSVRVLGSKKETIPLLRPPSFRVQRLTQLLRTYLIRTISWRSMVYLTLRPIAQPITATVPLVVSSQSSNIFRWYADNMEDFPILHQMALDTLSVPAMSTEYERVFSSTKKPLSPHRCCIKEASE